MLTFHVYHLLLLAKQKLMVQPNSSHEYLGEHNKAVWFSVKLPGQVDTRFLSSAECSSSVPNQCLVSIWE